MHELRQQLEEAHREKTPESKEQDDLEKLQAKVSKITVNSINVHKEASHIH